MVVYFGIVSDLIGFLSCMVYEKKGYGKLCDVNWMFV